MSTTTVVLDRDDMRRTLVRIAHEIVEKNPPGEPSTGIPDGAGPIGAAGTAAGSVDAAGTAAGSVDAAGTAAGSIDAAGTIGAAGSEAGPIGAAGPLDPTGHIAIVGIQRRGAVLARRLHALTSELIEPPVPLGFVDISFYRDDLRLPGKAGAAPVVHATQLDFSVDGRTIVIVDDVLYTGRTVRAAIDEIFDFGRPARVQLAVLIDRGHRELPIRPDYVGKNLPTAQDQRVNVRVDEIDGYEEVTIGPASEPRRQAA